ncbi:MAG: beta-L-arabinofuranosidase domain-containing protein, partial [Terracidiphilus sp.]
MTLSRRDFLVVSSNLGAGLALANALPLGTAWAADAPANPALAPWLTGMRMAATPATAWRAYRSRISKSAAVTTWVQVDLGRAVAIDAILLYPACENGAPGRDGYYGGESFPLRFRIEAEEDEAFARPRSIADFTQADFPDPEDNITRYPARNVTARYVRLTATALRPVKVAPSANYPDGAAAIDGPDFSLMIARLAVLSGGVEVGVGAAVTTDPALGNPALAAQLTRPPRPDGDQVRYENPAAVTDPATWHRPQFRATVPRDGVTLNGGVFETALRNNIDYLLNSYSVADLLRQFYERTGKVKDFKPHGSQVFWEEDLAGSNAGRFLMGAGNALRWVEHTELRRRLDAVVDGIEECRQPNGYIMAYPEETIFYSERAAYTRAWLTHGLLEAAYLGNPKPLPLLRGYYDWFNRQAFLPLMLRGSVQGGQGMVANTRVALSRVGKPADVQVIQRYYQEDAWLHGLANREREQVWQYPYDRPHCYLLTNLEAYMDLYLATGEPLYHDAVLGAWELYRAHWQQAGGSVSIIEFEPAPPDSNYLHVKLGELCGNSFWTFLSQRFLQLNPEDERFATEIEKSIYNVALANQDGSAGLRYHTILEGKKEASTHENTCCEGQGTRLLGSLPEHIFSIAPDGLFVHLYEPSTIRWQHHGQQVELALRTRFPFENGVEAAVNTAAPVRATLRFRVPSWAAAPVEIAVNGAPAATGTPGSYVALDRTWVSGDTVSFTLPAALRVTRYLGADQIPGKQRYALESGPVLMAAV